MTAVDDRRMTEFFESLEAPEGIKVELLRGEVVMMAGPDWVHNKIVLSVQVQIPYARWDALQTQDIAIPGEASEPQPDLVVIERGAFEGPGRLVPAAAVTLVVEVVSKTSVDRDYGRKRSIYAAGRIPGYLIIDPMEAQCVLLTEPQGKGDEADYMVERIVAFADPVPLGDLLDIKLDTGEFRTLPPLKRRRRP